VTNADRVGNVAELDDAAAFGAAQRAPDHGILRHEKRPRLERLSAGGQIVLERHREVDADDDANGAPAFGFSQQPFGRTTRTVKLPVAREDDA
jgi:hypothetical protein